MLGLTQALALTPNPSPIGLTQTLSSEHPPPLLPHSPTQAGKDSTARALMLLVDMSNLGAIRFHSKAMDGLSEPQPVNRAEGLWHPSPGWLPPPHPLQLWPTGLGAVRARQWRRHDAQGLHLQHWPTAEWRVGRAHGGELRRPLCRCPTPAPALALALALALSLIHHYELCRSCRCCSTRT